MVVFLRSITDVLRISESGRYSHGVAQFIKLITHYYGPVCIPLFLTNLLSSFFLRVEQLSRIFVVVSLLLLILIVVFGLFCRKIQAIVIL